MAWFYPVNSGAYKKYTDKGMFCGPLAARRVAQFHPVLIKERVLVTKRFSGSFGRGYAENEKQIVREQLFFGLTCCTDCGFEMLGGPTVYSQEHRKRERFALRQRTEVQERQSKILEKFIKKAHKYER